MAPVLSAGEGAPCQSQHDRVFIQCLLTALQPWECCSAEHASKVLVEKKLGKSCYSSLFACQAAMRVSHCAMHCFRGRAPLRRAMPAILYRIDSALACHEWKQGVVTAAKPDPILSASPSAERGEACRLLHIATDRNTLACLICGGADPERDRCFPAQAARRARCCTSRPSAARWRA